MPIDKKDIPVTDRAVTMEKIIVSAKIEAISSLDRKYTAVLQTHGTSALWAWSSRTTSRTHGDRNS